MRPLYNGHPYYFIGGSERIIICIVALEPSTCDINIIHYNMFRKSIFIAAPSPPYGRKSVFYR